MRTQTRKHTRRQFGKQQKGTLVRALFAAFLLAMLILPVTGQRVGAEDIGQIDPIILDEVILDDVILEDPLILEELPVDEADPPLVELDQLPDLEDVLEITPVIGDPPIAPSDLYVNPILCPYDVDLWGLDYYGLAFNCNLGWANGYELYVLDAWNSPWIHQVINDSYAGQSGLPAGDYYISLTHPASGYSPMRIICTGEDLQGNDIDPTHDLSVFEYGGTLGLQGNLIYWCDAFVVQDAPYVPGGENLDVYVNKHTCPEGIYSENPYFLASVCHGTLEGVEFSLTDNSGISIAYTAGFPAIASWSGISGSSITLDEVIPAGYNNNPVAFCSTEDLQGNDLDDPTYAYLALDGTWTVPNIPAEAASIFCDVFNFPTDSEGGSITVFKYGCPDGFDPSVGDVYNDCGALMEGVQFNTFGPNGYAAQTNTSDSIYGAVYFGGLEAGDYSVIETAPSGYYAYLVSCYSDTKQFVVQHEEDLTDAPQLDWNLDDNEDIVCFWYNVPSDYDDDADVFITKWECPDGYYSDDHQDLLDNCTTEQEGVDFTIEHESGATATDDTGGQPARAAFTPWLTGNSTITEDVPNGYGEPKAFCYAQDEFGTDVPGYELAPYAVSGGSISVTIPALANEIVTFYCDWFNFPDNDGWVTIHKWECPDGIELGWDIDYYLAECTEVMENVEFAHDQLGGSGILVYTDSNGDVSFSVDPNSDWVVEEHVPAGFGDPVVFCGWGGFKYGSDGTSIIAIDGYAFLDGTQGASLEFQTYEDFGMDCNWFNIPYDDDQDITIYKYTCPAGYDLSSPAADPKADCTELTNGVNFHLLPDGGIELQTQTGDSINGAVYFGGVDATNFEIWEDVPAGTAGVYVTCQWFEDLGPYVYQQFDVLGQYGGSSLGNGISVALSEGDELVCQWYNAPEKTWDGGDLTIYKYWCEGYVVSDATCELGAGVKFIVTPLGYDGAFLTETGPDGYVGIVGLTPGAYDVQEKDYEWCKAISTKVDAEGNVVIEEGQETILTVYNCKGNDTGKKGPPVKEFPNTGAGDFQATSDDEMILLSGLALLATVMMALAVRGKGFSMATVAIRSKR